MLGAVLGAVKSGKGNRPRSLPLWRSDCNWETRVEDNK